MRSTLHTHKDSKSAIKRILILAQDHHFFSIKNYAVSSTYTYLSPVSMEDALFYAQFITPPYFCTDNVGLVGNKTFYFFLSSLTCSCSPAGHLLFPFALNKLSCSHFFCSQ